MGEARANSAADLGFLTVHECATQGLFGGYLVLNAAGRPLQFHCTAPVKPNRAQEILYGVTLAPFLYGEQIGQTLVKQSKEKPQLLCVDCPEMLSLAPLVKQPVVLIDKAREDRAPTQQTGNRTVRMDAAHDGPGAPHWFTVGAHRVCLASAHAADQQIVTERLESLPPNFDLAEPFDRIRQAIAEAGGAR